MRVDGNERNLSLVIRIAEALDDLRTRCREASPARQFKANEIAVVGSARVVGKDRPAFQFLAVDGFDRAAATLRRAVNAEETALLARQLLDRHCFVGHAAAASARQFLKARQDVVADADLDVAAVGCHDDTNDRPLAVILFPLERLSNEVAVLVAPGDFKRRNGRQFALLPKVLLVARKRAFFRHLGEQTLQCDPRTARYTEGSRDLTLSGLALGGI